LRQTILTGYQLRSEGAESADTLLQHWTGKPVESRDDDWRSTMQSWATWFNEKYPAEEPIKLGADAAAGKYSVDQVLTYLEQQPASGRVHHGMLVFSRAQCSSCHRFNGQGEALGPDLSTLSRRFSQRETMRSILHPSEIIPDQFASKKVLTTDGRQLLGLLSKSGNDYILLQTDGKKLTLASDEVEEILPAETSTMPEGLLNELSLDEIRDLMAYLYSQPGKLAEKPASSATESR
jgi:putative heme-binding domain-containing protein